MRIENGALILGVKLCTDVPFQTWDFYNFHEVALGIFSHARHACPFVFFLIFVVEFVTMAMTFLDVLLLINVKHARLLLQHTFVCTQTHCTTHVGNVFLLLHDVNYVMFSFLVHFTTVGIFVA